MSTTGGTTPTSVAVIGAGGVGRHLAASLVVGGASVTLLGPEHLVTPVTEDGISSTAFDAPPLHVEPAALCATTDAAALSEADVVLVATRTGNLAEAVTEAAPHLPSGAEVITVQPGIKGPHTVRSALAEADRGDLTVRTGVLTHVVEPTGRTTVHRGTSGALYLEGSTATRTVARLLTAAELTTRLTPAPHSVAAAWLVWSLNDAVNALSGVALADELALRDYRRCTALCQREALTVLSRAAQVDDGSIPEVAALREKSGLVSDLYGLATAKLPAIMEKRDFFFRRALRHRITMDAETRTPMARDLDEGQASEIHQLQGWVAATGEQLGIPVPVNRRMAELVSRVERTALKSGVVGRAERSARGRRRMSVPAFPEGLADGREYEPSVDIGEELIARREWDAGLLLAELEAAGA